MNKVSWVLVPIMRQVISRSFFPIGSNLHLVTGLYFDQCFFVVGVFLINGHETIMLSESEWKIFSEKFQNLDYYFNEENEFLSDIYLQNHIVLTAKSNGRKELILKNSLTWHVVRLEKCHVLNLTHFKKSIDLTLVQLNGLAFPATTYMVKLIDNEVNKLMNEYFEKMFNIESLSLAEVLVPSALHADVIEKKLEAIKASTEDSMVLDILNTCHGTIVKDIQNKYSLKISFFSSRS